MAEATDRRADRPTDWDPPTHASRQQLRIHPAARVSIVYSNNCGQRIAIFRFLHDYVRARLREDDSEDEDEEGDGESDFEVESESSEEDSDDSDSDDSEDEDDVDDDDSDEEVCVAVAPSPGSWFPFSSCPLDFFCMYTTVRAAVPV